MTTENENTENPTHSELNDGVPMEDPQDTEPVNHAEEARQAGATTIPAGDPEHTPEESDS